MPNYKYRCIKCDYEEKWDMPISTNPKLSLYCPSCELDGTMTRRISVAQFPKEVGKVFAGDWYKKEYGHEIGSNADDKVQQKKDWETLKRESEKERGC